MIPGSNDRSLLADLPRLAILSLLGLLFLMPYIWMVSVSLKPLDEVWRASMSLIPETFAIDKNYGRVFREVPIGRYLLNGAIVCAGILVFQLAFALPAGYALAKLNFRGRETLFAFVMLGLLIPAHVPAIPLYIAFAQTGILNTYAALIAPSTISVFAIFMFRQFFRAMPDELIQAARMDGLGEWSIVWRIVVPNAWPAATAFAIFSSSPTGMTCSGRSSPCRGRASSPLRRSASSTSAPRRRATISAPSWPPRRSPPSRSSPPSSSPSAASSRASP